MVVIILLAIVFIASSFYFYVIRSVVKFERTARVTFTPGVTLDRHFIKWHKTKLFLSATIAALSFAMELILICNRIVCISASGRCYDEISELPNVKTAILLGTSIKGRYTPTNPYFRPRIEGVLSLYRAGKIDQVFITGDSANIDYNEPRWMADSLEVGGIPKEAITLDFNGSHTKESVEHAAAFTNCGACIVVSQRFQNERFIYMAKWIGWDVKGLNCGNFMHRGVYQIRQRVREGLSRIKAVFVGCSKEVSHASTK